MSVHERLVELGILLPKPAAPVATYVPVVVHGGIAMVSGQLPMEAGALAVTGKLGAGVGVEAGQRAARLCLINILAQLDAALPSGLNGVMRIIRLGGFIAATADFTEHAKVMNGASDLAVEIFGERGRHARSTVGVPSLPLDAAVEIEALIGL